MPSIAFADVISYSSEDKNHPAKNLLKPDSYLKWKCKPNSNEKHQYVILKLKCLSLIQSVDIGNEHSAFVEVLVAREGVDFQVLLVASSFMTPLESRNSTSPNRVRLFGFDKLNKSIADQEWDRIKVICTQPFNKNVQYGLAFIHLQGKDEKSEKMTETSHTENIRETKLGQFTLRENDDKSIIVGSLFANRRAMESAVSPAAIRTAQVALQASPKAMKRNNPNKDDQSVKKKERPSHEVSKTASKQLPISSSSKPITHTKKTKPFESLMDDVIFVLSGYQNPKRSQLRDKMLEIGAKYKADWDKTCTHLICAYTNTPKFQVVRGKGKIVSAKWIEDCYSKKMRLPWRRYNMEENRGAPESEDEIWAAEKMTEDEQYSNKDKEYNLDETDTDDEIEKAMHSAAKCNSLKDTSLEVAGPSKNYVDDYNADTDVDEDQLCVEKDTSSLPLPPLDNYFLGKNFLIYGSMKVYEEKSIRRYIIAFGGKLSNHMNESVNFVITENSWDDNFDDALLENLSLQFVRPEWILACCQKKKYLPPQRFLVSSAN